MDLLIYTQCIYGCVDIYTVIYTHFKNSEVYLRKKLQNYLYVFFNDLT